MTSAAVPLSVTEAVPLLVMVTPPPAVAVSVPFVTLTTLLIAPPAPAATVMALPLPLLKTLAVSSLVVCAAGTVFTGSATAVTVMATVSVSVWLVSVLTIVRVSAPL